MTGLLLALCAPGSQHSRGAPAPVPTLLVVERSDPGTRAEGLVARRLAVHADGTVLATGGDLAYARAELEPAALASLCEAVSRARLAELPDIVESRAHWFDLRDAHWTLDWSGAGPAEVRVAGDLRPGSADRALAPHGLVELLEFLESIPLSGGTGAGFADEAAAEFELEPWSPGDASHFAAFVEVAPLAWPRGAPAPVERRVRAAGEPARALFDAARAGQRVEWSGRTWRVRAKPLFPGESVPRAAAVRSDGAARSG